MKRAVILLSCLLALSLFAADVTADHIARITIKNSFQAELASQVIGQAHIRSGNDFIVTVSNQQLSLLQQSGISIELIFRETDPSGIALLRSLRHPRDPRTDMSRYGPVIEVSPSTYLVESGRAAAPIPEGSGIISTPLNELNIPITYVPPAMTTLLHQLQVYPSDSLINRVSQDSIYAHNTRLEDFYTRYIWTDSIDHARDWIVQKFLDWGYTDVTTPQFWWDGDWHYNVMAVKPGYAEPDKVIVIGGHYDSITYGQPEPAWVYAPGADDNGSGTTTVLEIARVLADIPLRKTVIFMAFSAEEVGLVGSWYAAEDFMFNGTDIEVMFNFDMVGFTEDTFWDISIGPSNDPYMELTGDAATRVTSMIPVPESSPGGSDHMSFEQHGYKYVNTIEADFNWDGWHTDIDITDRMNFGYLTEVVRMAVASVAIVADAAHPTDIEAILDVGDGQSVEVVWSDCDSTYTYLVMYGATSGNYPDTIAVAPGQCSYVVDGLTEGQTYYFSVVGDAPGGYPAVYTTEDSGASYVVPRAPSSLTAEPEYNSIVVDWQDNTEKDFSHYRVYRKFGGYVLYKDNYTSSTLIDTSVFGQVEYSYKVTAVDLDGHESEFSDEGSTYAATFNGGVLVVDEMTAGPGIPPQDQQETYFTDLLGTTPYALSRIESESEVVSRGQCARYSSVFWFDDDLVIKAFNYSEDTLAWYAGYPTNLLVTGLRTIYFSAGSPLSSGDLLYDAFGLSAYTENQATDFAGAVGQNGWPSLQVDPGGFFGPRLPNVFKLVPRPGATVIATWDSFSDDPAYEGEPCGLMYQTADGYRVLLAFPLYFMTDASAQAFVAYVKGLFGEDDVYETDGDVDGSGTVNVADLSYLVNYLFLDGPAPVSLNGADADASCEINVADLSYLVTYLFLNGPAPLPGCVE